MDNTFQDLMWIYWSIKSYRRRKGEIFREDREEEDGGFELYKSILFKYFNDNGFHFFFFRYSNDNNFDFKLRGTESNQPK